jgi:hypothetical protein
MLDAQPVDQYRVDEFRGAEFAQTLVERQTQHPINPFSRQQLKLVTQARQSGWRRGRRKKLSRLRLENNHATGQPQFDSTITQARQDSLVAPVNTVKVANGGDAAPMPGAQIVEASNQLHNALLAHKVADYNHTQPRTTGNTPRQNNSHRPTVEKTDDYPLQLLLTSLRCGRNP